MADLLSVSFSCNLWAKLSSHSLTPLRIRRALFPQVTSHTAMNRHGRVSSSGRVDAFDLRSYVTSQNAGWNNYRIFIF